MKNLITLALLTIFIQSFGQIKKESVDSLIIAKTDEKFFQSLSFSHVVSQKVWDYEKIWE